MIAAATVRVFVAGFVMVLLIAFHPRRWRPDLALRDFLPFAIYLPIVANGHLAFDFSISWSIPASQLL